VDAVPGITPAEQEVHDALATLGIAFERFAHPPVFTVEEAGRYWAEIPATHCKNLFLRNAKGSRHYLVVLGHAKQADLRALSAALGDDRLSFASPDRLMRFLRLTPGAVSPFGLIHDSAREVIVVLDADLPGTDRIGFHPNVNTATITLPTAEFLRFLTSRGNSVKRLVIGLKPEA
jgi:Ala-tRNA(Pro) deacylase